MAKEQPIDDGLIDKEAVEKADDKAKKLRERELGDIRTVLKTPEGRRWYWKLMAHAGAFRTPFAAQDNLTNKNCGRQEIGFFMLDELLEASPAMFVQMQRESKSNIEPEE
jgi:hypothetical protein